MADSLPDLADLTPLPFLTTAGTIDPSYEKRIGVYAIFDQHQTLQYVGYSRNLAISLLQHLVRQPDHCHGLKVHTVDRPDRQLLVQIQNHWLTGQFPPGNGSEAKLWSESINVQDYWTAAEATTVAKSEEGDKPKLLKKIARRLEAEILAKLEARGVRQQIRFNPKLKEQGLLDVT
ncbi:MULTISPECIES: GIY-YIG nuclease family protein [unclassified Synechocystis]|uniref:GIY-YIG nuclease family protein n=1 Tax=unclassified Synechocystis TaxID=2640012 RepID=UPI0004290775|nr:MULTISPECIES: GIY-YIG nuclease family protein [unclassified Synechocystis]AIE73454.1 hypothetical protein D082_09260 [Synechocystis sp. PCC 6714]MCT0254189.1 GIY-YIG nuclease family protein [Synechocystis sp. CS-94]